MRWRALALLAGLACVVAPAAPAAAHPLDAYLQLTYLSLDANGAEVELDLSPGVLVAPRVLRDIDLDGDGVVSAAEGRRYLTRVVAATVVRIDGRLLTLTVSRVSVPPYRTIEAGYGTLVVLARTPPNAAPLASGSHRVQLVNGFADPKAKYQVNTFVAPGAPIVLGPQERDATQQQISVTYRVGRPSSASASVDAPPSRSRSLLLGPAGTAALAVACYAVWVAVSVLSRSRRRDPSVSRPAALS